MQDTVNKAIPMSQLKTILNQNGPERDQYEIMNEFINGLFAEKRSLQETVDGIKNFNFLKDITSIIGHVLNKPFGYAGDYQIIDRFYTNDVSKEHYLWDKYILNSDAVKAVQNRKTYFKKLVLGRIRKNGKCKLLNIASGPARDLKEVYDLIDDIKDLNTTCIDMDSNAINYAKGVNDSYLSQIEFINKNIFKYNTKEQHDLVWSAGLFDYFNDKAFLMILKRMKEWINPNGEIVVGNFNADHNPTRPVMEILGDWHLHHRTEKELIELAIQAGFESNQITIGREPENVNLFLHIKNN